MHAVNHVDKMMNGYTVQENFDDLHRNYTSKNWRVYNANYKLWQLNRQQGAVGATGASKDAAGLRYDGILLPNRGRIIRFADTHLM